MLGGVVFITWPVTLKREEPSCLPELGDGDRALLWEGGAQSLAVSQWEESDREGTGGVVWSFDDTVGSRESVKG